MSVTVVPDARAAASRRRFDLRICAVEVAQVVEMFAREVVADLRDRVGWFDAVEELLGEQIAKPSRRLDRPHALAELGCPAEQLLELPRTRTHLNPRELLLALVDRDCRVRSLVRIDTDHHRHRRLPESPCRERQGGHS